MMRKKLMNMIPLLALVLVACVEVEPFVDLEANETYEPLDEAGVLSEGAKETISHFISTETYFDACVVIRNGQLVYNYGEEHLPFNLASVRKSIFSALYGIAADRGLIDLDASLAELGVDDSKNPLTETEKTATIRQLLQARSGIYIPAAGESSGMKRRRPERGAYLPGEHFYYNNWDFNTLPIILESITGKPVGQLIYEWLAVPTGMRDFQPEDVTYQYVDYTEYPQTRVYMSANDLARIGAVYENEGRWNGRQVVPKEWIETSTAPVSLQPEDADLLENELMEGYAYLWWVDTDADNFWADGSGGQFMIVDQQNNLVVVLRNNTGLSPASYVLYSATERFEGNIRGNEVYKFIRSKIAQ